MWQEQKSGTWGVAECGTDVLTTFWRLLWSITESDERQHGIDLFYIIAKSLFYFKIFQHNAKGRKKPFDVIFDLSKIKQFHWLLCVAKNYDWSRKIAPLSSLTRASFLVEWKLTAKAELRLEESSQFLSSEQPCELKSLDVALKITGVEKIPSENLWLRST